MEEQVAIKDLLIKYTINPTSKKELLEKLAQQNITKDSIYVEIDDEIEKLIIELKLKYNL